MQASKQDSPPLSAIPMQRHHDVTLVPLLVLTAIEAAPCSANQFPKRRTFH